VLRRAADAGEMRSVEVMGAEYEALEPGVLEDLKVGFESLIGRHSGAEASRDRRPTRNESPGPIHSLCGWFPERFASLG